MQETHAQAAYDDNAVQNYEAFELARAQIGLFPRCLLKLINDPIDITEVLIGELLILLF